MPDASLLPTPLLSHQQSRPVEVREVEKAALGRSLRIALQLTKWIARAIARRILGRPLGPAMAAEIRGIIEEMGGLWVKTGQLLSLRTDVLSPEFSRELSRLQYAAVGFPFPLARQAIEAELGRPLEEVFSEFEEHPIAAASISQVHRARLRDGDVLVAVKVQRPGIERRFLRDLRVLGWLLKAMEHIPGMSYFAWDEMLWETEQIFQEEVDYRYEASNTRRLRKSLSDHGIHVPRVFDCSTRRVLVMEWMPGELMSAYLEMAREDPGRLAAWCEENEIDPVKVGEKLFLTFFRQLFEDNLFHGDLHPGNILLLRDNNIALIDFGSAGSNDATMLDFYKLSMKGVGEKDFPMAVDYLFLMAERLPPIDLEVVKEKVVRSYQAWSERAEQKELPYYEKSIGNMGLEAGNVLIQYKVVLSWSFMKISRTWATLDASLATLIPEVNYMKLVAKYFRGARSRGWSRLRKRGMMDLAQAAQSVRLEADLQLEELRHTLFRSRAVLSKGQFVAAALLRFGTRALQIAVVVVLVIYVPHKTATLLLMALLILLLFGMRRKLEGTAA
ncbi:MAG TPA: AarF/ABC1/UbiB kinase family protein [Thermoanaerobaculia bacterium]|jgi:ubiquinone biosynthesis protein